MEKIDFSKYDEKPVFKIQELMNTILLNQLDTTDYYLLFLRQHSIETQDMWLQLGESSIEDNFY